MRLKYAKLVLNLANAVDAMFAEGPDADRLADARPRRGRRGARAPPGSTTRPTRSPTCPQRWERMGVRRDQRPGSSTWQSLRRGTGAVETDYLNGEIVLLGRLHGVADSGQRGADPACRAAAREAPAATVARAPRTC